MFQQSHIPFTTNMNSWENKLLIKIREMIFVQPFYNIICDNFVSHTHIIFLFSLYYFDFCVNTSFSLTQMVVKITQF